DLRQTERRKRGLTPPPGFPDPREQRDDGDDHHRERSDGVVWVHLPRCLGSYRLQLGADPGEEPETDHRDEGRVRCVERRSGGRVTPAPLHPTSMGRATPPWTTTCCVSMTSWVPAPPHRSADRAKIRTDTAVSTAANVVTTRRLSQAIIGALVIPQMSRSPPTSPRSPYRIRARACVIGSNLA